MQKNYSIIAEIGIYSKAEKAVPVTTGRTLAFAESHEK